MSLLDFFFPPLCLYCKRKTKTSYFCPSCWELLTPIDPSKRCIHCFSEQTKAALCIKCFRSENRSMVRAAVFEKCYPSEYLAKTKDEYVEAIASFFLYQWAKLNWDRPDLVLSVSSLSKVAKAFSFFLDTDYEKALFFDEEGIQCKSSYLIQDKVVLVLNEQLSSFQIKNLEKKLLRFFPKKVYQLSLLT